MERAGAWHATAALLLTAASGFAGLAYQIVWTQQGALWLGHESAAVLAVVAAFFGGMSLGALCFGRAVQASMAPLRWYVACECLIALWALVLSVGFRPATAALLALIGPEPSMRWHWTVAFGGTLLLLLPSTAAMGLALPALERIVSRTGSSVFGGLYAANTFGAVLGVLATAFWLIPTHGLTATASVSALVNLFCAASALVLFRGTGAGRSAEGKSPLNRAPRRAALLRLAMTGLLGIGYEVVALRVLSEVTEETVYTFACALAVYLVGTTLGAAVYQRWWTGRADADRFDAILPVALWCASLLGAAGLWFADSLRIALGAALGSSLIAAISTEAVLAVSAFALPTLVMGALFSHLCTVANDNGAGFGEAIGWNGAGAALAPAAFGVMAVPALGAKWSLLLLSVGYLAVLPRRAWHWSWMLPPLAATLVLALLAPRLAFIDVPPGGRVISYEEGATAAVSVVEDGEGVARLRIDNRQQEGSSASRWVDGRQAWLPMLLHPAPHRALFLGLGTGVTASTAAQDAQVRVDAVELLPEVIAASGYFTSTMADGSTSRPHLIAADARHYVRTSDQQYDVVVSDNFHPARSGAGSLYTLEHFLAVRARLTADGVFCQWLPLHQLDLGTLRSIVQSFLAAYPHAAALLASNSLQTPVLGLVGRADDGLFNIAALRRRLGDAALSETWAKSGIEDDLALLGSFVAGPAALRRFAADAPLNTDDLPIVAYRAPRITYAPDSLPRDRLIELLHELTAQSADLFELPDDGQWPFRLSAYWAARNLYVEAGRDVQPTSDVRLMLAQVQAPLLAVLRRSPDFRPAYDPLLRMAAAMARTDSSAARILLAELVRVQPARPEAARMLSQLAN